MKVLYVTTIGTTMGFFRSFVRLLLNQGHQVDIATNEKDGPVPECYREWGCRIYLLSCSRTPFNRGNIKAIKEIKQIVSENMYDIVHCHTPIAAACTRMACKSLREKGVRVFYTAHGFHFYKGAPIKNWLVYYPVEWLCSFWTDTLITINKEDYARAKRRFHAKSIEYVPGVGIDTEKFKPNLSSRKKIREELELDDKTIILLSVGELNKNKNHSSVIRAIKGIDNLVYVIVGKGDKQQELEALAKECEVDLRLMGYRSDVADLYNAADLYILPSIREGLNVSLMEAMACGLPCLASNIRGNTDLIDDNSGFTFSPNNTDEIKEAIKNVNGLDMKKIGDNNREKIKAFSIIEINNAMNCTYQ